MPINPAIAMSFQAPKFEDPMNNLIKMEQIKAYQQNALAKQLEAEVAQESLGQQRGLSNYLAGLESGASPDMNMLARFGKTGREYGKDIAEVQSKQMEMASKLYKEKYLPILGQARTRDDVLAWHKSMEDDLNVRPILTPQGKAMLPKSDADVPDYIERTLVPIKDRYSRKDQLASQINDLYKALYSFDPNSGKQVIDVGVQNRLNELLGQYSSMNGAAAQPAGNLPMPPAPPSVGAIPSTAGMPPDLAAGIDQASGAGAGATSIDTAAVTGRKKTAELEAKATVANKEKRKEVQKTINSIDKLVFEGEGEKRFNRVFDMIDKSTSGGLQTMGAEGLGFFGVGTSGMEEIGKLKTIQSNITSTLLSGKLGAGISNADREFIESTLGSISDSKIPSSVRKAAFQEFMRGLESLRTQGFIIEPGSSTDKQENLMPKSSGKEVPAVSSGVTVEKWD